MRRARGGNRSPNAGGRPGRSTRRDRQRVPALTERALVMLLGCRSSADVRDPDWVRPGSGQPTPTIKAILRMRAPRARMLIMCSPRFGRCFRTASWTMCATRQRASARWCESQDGLQRSRECTGSRPTFRRRASFLSFGGRSRGIAPSRRKRSTQCAEGLKIAARCETSEQPLPGLASSSRDEAPPFLRSLYGARAVDVMALTRTGGGLEQRLASGIPDIAAEVVFSVRSEHCRRNLEFIRRRSRLRRLSRPRLERRPPGGRTDGRRTRVAARKRIAEEIGSYGRDIALTRAFNSRS